MLKTLIYKKAAKIMFLTKIGFGKKERKVPFLRTRFVGPAFQVRLARTQILLKSWLAEIYWKIRHRLRNPGYCSRFFKCKDDVAVILAKRSIFRS